MQVSSHRITPSRLPRPNVLFCVAMGVMKSAHLYLAKLTTYSGNYKTIEQRYTQSRLDSVQLCLKHHIKRVASLLYTIHELPT
jgi:hypothetical protein